LMVVLVPQYIQYVEKSRIATDESAISEIAHSAEVSMAEESVFDNLPTTATFDIVVADGAVVTAGTATKLATEINKIVDPVVLKSKAYKGGTFTIKVTYVAADKTYTVGKFVKSADGTIDATNSGITFAAKP
ncbi:MAG: hypothetical protein RR885_05705, partial [Oscillospiraceae bacterium]